MGISTSPPTATESTTIQSSASVETKPPAPAMAPETARDRFQRLVRRLMVVIRLMPKDDHQSKPDLTRSIMHDMNVQTPGTQPETIPPINGSQPFATFWQDKPSSHTFGDTVSHRWVVKPPGWLQAESWHLKTPGKEASTERFKRFLQKMIYWVTGKPYKSSFFDDRQLLTQREVLAANVYKAAMLTSPHDTTQPSDSMDRFNDEYEVAYSCDPGDSDHPASHSIAARHLNGYTDASELFSEAALPTLDDFEENFDPVTNLVIRRFLLGDEDSLKPENYMFSKIKESDGRIRTKLCSIDFGMGFYNCFDLPDYCSLEAFQKRLLTPSWKHTLQYLGKPTLLTLLKNEDSQRIQGLIKNALSKIARMDDQSLNALVGHIYDPNVRRTMLKILQFKVQQAQAIVSNTAWPVCPGPVSHGRQVMNNIRARRNNI
ncbi:MAG: hypothetical protein ACPG5T_00130 [Endozoicomonas sp.]